MQLQSETTDTRTWDRNEIKQLIEYANYLKEENDTLQAKVIMIDAKLRNEEAKVKYLNNILNTMIYGTEGN